MPCENGLGGQNLTELKVGVTGFNSIGVGGVKIRQMKEMRSLK
jgi:hypothetical protein